MVDVLPYFPQRSQVKEETLIDENTQILYRLQTSLIWTIIAELGLLGLASTTNLSLIYQVLICRIFVLLLLF